MSSGPRIEALVLAGRRAGEHDPLAGFEGAPHKALLLAGGRPLIARVVETLGRFARIRIAAPPELRPAIAASLKDAGWSFAETAASPASTILAALDELPAGRSLLVTTSDHALLSAPMIDAFLAGAASADAAAACVERTLYEARFPGSRRTFINLKDFSFSGANLFLFAGARPLAEFWRRLEQKRKKPLAMAREIGLGSFVAYLSGQMTKAKLEAAITAKTGVRVRLVSLETPEAAIDVDRPDDLLLVRRILAEREASPRSGKER